MAVDPSVPVWGVVLLQDPSPSDLPVMRFSASFTVQKCSTASARCGFCTSDETTAAAATSSVQSDSESTSRLTWLEVCLFPFLFVNWVEIWLPFLVGNGNESKCSRSSRVSFDDSIQMHFHVKTSFDIFIIVS
jgi:hypothetical protein